MLLVVARVDRMIEIWKILVEQIRILETMTPLDFLDFRDYLAPASGFQSYQFRLFENKLGVEFSRRIAYQKEPYYQHFSDTHKDILMKSQNELSLFKLVEMWLERTPIDLLSGFDFWNLYKTTVLKHLDDDEVNIKNNALLKERSKDEQLKQVAETRKKFNTLFDQVQHDKLIEQGVRRLSHKATQAALIISLYRDEPLFSLPFKLLTQFIDLDKQVSNWRYKHSNMVHGMIGTKVGTGGSTGYHYLRATALSEGYNVFADLYNLSSFLIPRSKLPLLPKEFKKHLDFYFTAIHEQDQQK